MAQAILLSDVENARRAGRQSSTSPRATCATTSCRASSRSRPRRRRSRSPSSAPSRPRCAQREAAARAQENASLLQKTVLTITQQAGEDGRLFGSVTAQDIADAIKEARGIRVDRRKIHLDDPIRHVGTHMVVVEVSEGITAAVKTMVVEQK